MLAVILKTHLLAKINKVLNRGLFHPGGGKQNKTTTLWLMRWYKKNTIAKINVLHFCCTKFSGGAENNFENSFDNI